MQIGSALHALVLEGREVLERQFIVKPTDIRLNTKEGKAWKEEHKSFTILSQEAMDKVEEMGNQLFSLDYFDTSQKDYRKFNEVSIYWDADRIPCKARLDRVVVHDDHVEVVDLKTTDTVDYSIFQKKVVYGFNYLFQAAWYAEAASIIYQKPAHFTFVAIERDSPCTTAIFKVSAEAMEEGVRQIKKARRILGDCLREGEWSPPVTEEFVLFTPANFIATPPEPIF